MFVAGASALLTSPVSVFMVRFNYYKNTKMDPLNLVIRIDGPEANDGFDLFEFAPNLLALGKVIKEAGNVLDVKKELGINIKPIEKGSFIIELALFSKDNIGGLLDALHSNDARDIKEILEWVGLLSGAVNAPNTIVSLFDFIRFLGKKPPVSKSAVEGGKIKYINGDGQQIIISGQVDALYNNPVIHQHYYNAFRSLEKDGVDTQESYIKGDEENTRKTLTKDDLQYLAAYSGSELDSQEDIGQESIYDTSLNFKRGSYEGESNQWSFRKGNSVITAVIRDKEFLDKIGTGVIRPYAKDLLRVSIREVPRMVGTDIVGFNYEILEVKDYKPHQESRLL